MKWIVLQWHGDLRSAEVDCQHFIKIIDIVPYDEFAIPVMFISQHIFLKIHEKI